jgi:hypothetical protein
MSVVAPTDKFPYYRAKISCSAKLVPCSIE